jgi:deazaflavin-dependent oxidoreductase (nitroreductase family)
MVSRRTQTLVTRAHRWVYRRTRGRIGGRLGSMEQVLLTTVGRVTGRPSTTPLTGIPDGDRVVLIASDGGKPQHPHWYRNLVVNPEVVVQRGPTEHRMRARTATPEERELLWRRAVGLYRGYAAYQSRTDRVIPVVVCEPL